MLSVIVITKNEEDRIRACLESVKWADEIIVVDNGSSDKTLDMARKYTNKVFVRVGQDFAAMRNFGMDKVKGDWVLYVDADERVLEPLKNEILEIIKQDTKSAYAISRKNIIFGQEKSYGPFWPDWVIRLLKKSDFEEWVGRVHEHPRFKGELSYSQNSFLHLTHRDVDHVVLKSLDWSNIDAELRLKAHHPPMSSWRFLRVLFTEIFNQGIKRKGFFAGTVGTIDAILQSFSLFITYVRLWQLQQPKPLEEIYNEIDNKLLEGNFNYKFHK